MCDGVHAGGVIVAQWHLCWQHHRGAAVIIGRSGAISSADFNGISGHVPLFVYYRVAVLFNKWYVSYRAVAII